ncbi:MAG: DUF1772 domain-containing protein [Parvibaculaceae bacterium]
MQAPLAIIGFLMGLLAWWRGSDWLWLFGAVTLLANWPYALLIIVPLNNRLMGSNAETVGPDVRALIDRWASLHASRTALGALAICMFLWASLR